MKVKITAKNYLDIPIGTVVNADVSFGSVKGGYDYDITAQEVLAHTTAPACFYDDDFLYFLDGDDVEVVDG